MGALSICFLAFVAAVTASVIPNVNKEHTVADEHFLYNQARVFELLYHVHEPTIVENQLEAAKDFDFDKYIGNFTDEKVVHNFVELYSHGFLPTQAIFSVTNGKLLQQAIELYKVFYAAKDFETLFSVASWAREHVNRDLFVYAFTIAVAQRQDLKGIIVPAPYEVNPYYYFNGQDIYLAAYYKLQKELYSEEDLIKYGILVKDNVVILNYNESYVRYAEYADHDLSYFTNDLGLNSYFYDVHIKYPFWLENHTPENRPGEHFYYFFQQLLARYYLERLSNGFGEIPTFSWQKPFNSGYHNALYYPGLRPFPSRSDNVLFDTQENFHYLKVLKIYETVLWQSLYRRYIELPKGERIPLETPEDIEHLGNYIRQYPVPEFSWIRLATKILGGAPKRSDSYHLLPSALEHVETCLRDPAYWQILKEWISPLNAFKDMIPAYTQKELSFPGLTVDKVEVTPLVTFWEDFYVDISNAVPLSSEEKTGGKTVFKLRQNRLNHEQFTVKFDVTSEEDVKSIIKVFIGPKYDVHNHSISLSRNQDNFVEIDQFVFDLKAGKNAFERDSNKFYHVTQDRTSAHDVYRHVKASVDGKEQFNIAEAESFVGLPDTLLLPKGSVGGFPIAVYVVVSPWVEPAVHRSGFLDGRALGYPFDRQVTFDYFHQSNMYWVDALVYHKDVSESNVSHHGH